MKVELNRGGAGDYFSAIEDGREIGRTDCYVDDDRNVVVLTHVELKPEFEGQGLGTVFVKDMAGYARDHGMKVIPECRFSHAVFMRDPSLEDVWYR